MELRSTLSPGGYMRKQSYSEAVFPEFREEQQRLQRQASILKEQELTLLVGQGILPHHDVLDLGCGNGQTAAMLSDYLKDGSITAIDINPAFIAQAAQQYDIPHLHFIQGSAWDLKDLPLFDFIYSRLVFQHLSEPLPALQQVWEQLHPGGKCCIIDVNDDWLFLQPALPAFDALVNTGLQQQQKAGGDRRIAKKLPLLLHQTGFSDIHISIIPFNSLQVGIEAFLDITLSFRANMDPGAKQWYQLLLDQIRIAPDQYFGMMGVSVITAMKPSS